MNTPLGLVPPSVALVGLESLGSPFLRVVTIDVVSLSIALLDLVLPSVAPVLPPSIASLDVALSMDSVGLFPPSIASLGIALSVDSVGLFLPSVATVGLFPPSVVPLGVALLGGLPPSVAPSVDPVDVAPSSVASIGGVYSGGSPPRLASLDVVSPSIVWLGLVSPGN
jgi:hypothetical protein